jgi:hypothetical protein
MRTVNGGRWVEGRAAAPSASAACPERLDRDALVRTITYRVGCGDRQHIPTSCGWSLPEFLTRALVIDASTVFAVLLINYISGTM